jgi:hypothetical protein
MFTLIYLMLTVEETAREAKEAILSLQLPPEFAESESGRRQLDNHRLRAEEAALHHAWLERDMAQARALIRDSECSTSEELVETLRRHDLHAVVSVIGPLIPGLPNDKRHAAALGSREVN